jgi:hypothetical protein
MDSRALSSEPYNLSFASIEKPEFFQLNRLEAKDSVISSLKKGIKTRVELMMQPRILYPTGHEFNR